MASYFSVEGRWITENQDAREEIVNTIKLDDHHDGT